MTRLTLPIAALALAAVPALAAVTDADGDGMYSFAEMLVTYPTLTEDAFVTIDSDGDGMLSPEEVATAEDSGLLTPEG